METMQRRMDWHREGIRKDRIGVYMRKTQFRIDIEKKIMDDDIKVFHIPYDEIVIGDSWRKRGTIAQAGKACNKQIQIRRDKTASVFIVTKLD